MFKKLSLLLAAVVLWTNMGIVTPQSAQAAADGTVLVKSNFANCNLGTYTEANQKNGTTDLRNGIVMTDNDAALSTGYTIKNSNGEYEPISEADIVDDGGTKVLRLNTFLGSDYDHADTTKYPVVKTNGALPTSGKIRIDLEMKMTPRASFWMYHSTSIGGGTYRLWRVDRENNSYSRIKVLDNTDTKKTFQCGQYNTYTIIMDTDTGSLDFYFEGELIKTATTSKLPSANWQLYLKQAPWQYGAPTVTYNSSDSTKIESVTNPQYVYVKSLKVIAGTEPEAESTPVPTQDPGTTPVPTQDPGTGTDPDPDTTPVPTQDPNPGTEPDIEINETVDTSISPNLLAVPEPITVYKAVKGKQHPYLMGNYFDTLKGYLKTDEHFKQRFNIFYREAKRKLKSVSTTNLNMLKHYVTFAEDEIIEYAFIYRLTGETEFAEGAATLIRKTLAINDWKLSNTIETASVSMVCAIGYDWIYDYLSETDRKEIPNKVWEKSLKYAYNIYRDPSSDVGGMKAWAVTCNHNWSLVCNAGFGAASLGFMNDLDSDKAAKCAIMVAQGINDVQWALDELGENGSWGEGVDYSQYGFLHLVKFVAALVESAGDDYGFIDFEPLKNNATFNMYLTGVKTCFNFHDCAQNFPNMLNLMFAAKYYNDTTYAVLRDKTLRMGALDMTVFDLLWYVPYDGSAKVDFDRMFDDAVIMRKSFDDNNGIFVGLHGGTHVSRGQFTNHGFMDQGTFVLDVLGERWVEALGGDQYSLAGYHDRTNGGQRWQYYRCRAEGANTLVINPSENRAMDQVWGYNTTFTTKNLNGTNPSASLNLTPVYNGAKNIVRTLKLTDNRKNAELTDEIQMNKASEIYWFMHTKATITLSEDGKTATLTQGSKQVKVKLSSPSNAVFTVMTATPLSTSPQAGGQKPNLEYRKLAIHLTDTQTTTITVKFEPQYQDDPMEVSDNCKDLFNSDFENTWIYPEKLSSVFDLGYFKADVNTLSDYKEVEIAQVGYNERALHLRWVKDTDAKLTKLTGGQIYSEPGSFNPSGVTVIDFSIKAMNTSKLDLDAQYASGQYCNLVSLKGGDFAVGADNIATATGDWQRVRVVLDTNTRRHMVIIDNQLVYSKEYPKEWVFGEYGLLRFKLTGGTPVSVDNLAYIYACRVYIGQLHIYTSDAHSYENMIAHKSDNGVRVVRFGSDLYTNDSATMTIYKAKYNGNTLAGIEKEDVTVKNNEEKRILNGNTSANAFYIWNKDMTPYFEKIE